MPGILTEVNRDFEKKVGYLTPADLPPIDWTNRAQIELLYPFYRREQLRFDAEGVQRSKAIEIDRFNLKSPDGTIDLFVNTKLHVEAFKRCAIFGINGSGKTTLFEAISSGNVKDWPTYIHVHHMKELEHDAAYDALSVMDTVLCSHPLRRVLLPIVAKLQELVTVEKDEQKLALLQGNLEYAEKALANVYGHYAEENVRSMLRVLGFDETGEKAPLNSLSGGLRMRVALACSFFIKPDLLLLDEPTNHLDMPSVLWLENKLRGYSGSFLLVTHDRTLLENVVTSVMLIQDLQLESFPCDFAEFQKRREKQDQAKERMIEQFLKRNGNLNPMSPLIKTANQYRAWLQARRDRKLLMQGKFTFQAPKPLVAPEGVAQEDISLIKIDNVRFSYDVEKGLPFIFDNPISYDVKMNTRVGVMGPNGAGKSTFLKLITGKLQPTSGTITTNPDFTLAYFGQHSTKELNLKDTALEFMTASFPKANIAVLKNHLSKTSISGDVMNTRMGNLSFSQRSCIIFAKLTFVPPHLLIMDEPTNFLDMDSIDSLIGAANKFSGALITVTHNRDFLKKCSKNYLSIVPSQFLEFKTMKEAERATYSFISALEEGKTIDVKNAIQENRGGGAIHTKEYLEASASRLNAQQKAAKEKADALQAEQDALAAIAAEKEAKRLAKVAKQKTDWVAGDECYAPVKNSYVKAVVVRNVPAMGVTVTLETGKTMMCDAKKLKVELPDAIASDAASVAGSAKSTASKASSKGPSKGPTRGKPTRGRGK